MEFIQLSSDEMPDRSVIVSQDILAALSLATCALLVYVTFKVFQLVRCSDPIFILMLICL